MAHLSPFDLTELASMADPHPFYERMRREDPVHWSEQYGAWFVTSYPYVSDLLRSPYMSNERMSHVANRQLKGLDPDIAKDYIRVLGKALFMSEPPQHTRLRRLTWDRLVPTALEHWRPLIQEVVNEALDQVEPAERMDAIAEFAEAIPSGVLSKMFGIPAEDLSDFKECSLAVATFFRSPTRDIEKKARQANAATLFLESYFLSLISQRRRNPGRDLLSYFIRSQKEGNLTEAELSAQCVSILAAGIVTTAEQLGNGMHALLAHTDQLDKLCKDWSLIKPVVQEILRFAAGGFIYKLAVRDLEVGGKAIRKGQIVFIGLASANRDEAIFEDPHRFDIGRKNSSQNLAFGLGRHTCTGSVLATMELELSIEALFRRFPALRPDPSQPPTMRWEPLSPRVYSSYPVLLT